MTDRELMQQALDALEQHSAIQHPQQRHYRDAAIAALRERLAQPEQEFTEHEEGEDGWSDWVCPDPKGYLMKCCDCGLVHEAQFAVVRYKSETEREDCDMVDDPNLQAVFRMRRSEQWTPKDTAYRPGGLAQPEQEPVAWRWKERVNNDFDSWVVTSSEPPPYAIEQQPLYTAPQQEPTIDKSAAIRIATALGWVPPGDTSQDRVDQAQKQRQEQEPVAKWDASAPLVVTPHPAFQATPPQGIYYTPPQRKPLTDEEIDALPLPPSGTATVRDLVRIIEAAHGIKE